MEEELNKLLKDVGATARTTSAPVGTPLKNEDFRQLLNRKPAPSTNNSAAQPQTSHSFSHRQAAENKKISGNAHKGRKQREKAVAEDDDDDLGKSNLSEILKNYRDRAEERRKGIGNDEAMDTLQANNAYRAVPGDVRATVDAAQRRKQAIQESKYLGGDIEHTHLVKGLDYSLLHKMRSEIAAREQKVENELEMQLNKDSRFEESGSENKMVRNLHRILFQSELPLRNELFRLYYVTTNGENEVWLFLSIDVAFSELFVLQLFCRKGRMAYVVELEEEENEVPTTRLRSLHDCPPSESSHDINTSNMLIQKLTQVLSYLRADTQKKKKRIEMTSEDRAKHASQPIFDDARDPKRTSDRDRYSNDKDRRRIKPSSYFEDNDKDRSRERGRDKDRYHDYDRNRNEKDRERRDRGDDDRRNGEKDRRREDTVKIVENSSTTQQKKRMMTETEGYAECYPGGPEMYEAAGESDDDADYSKMDMGNRRGPIKRWDFEDHEDYEKYMESKEAMPKAAYQFGVKTNDGRKTRKSGPDKEKHKLDREFSQITKIIEKRKQDSHRNDVAKRSRY
uniref:Protein Red n=1 Tax=Syphacia muris TaxID=451379 RepID=A0A0N5AV52_9BILA